MVKVHKPYVRPPDDDVPLGFQVDVPKAIENTADEVKKKKMYVQAFDQKF